MTNTRTYNPDLSKFPKWVNVLRQVASSFPPAKHSIQGEIDLVTNIFSIAMNKFRYLQDNVDEWKSPNQFEQNHGGDCEDFAIYWWERLRSVGIPEDRIEVVIGTVTQKFRPKLIHAVCFLHCQNGVTFVLDCMANDPYDYANIMTPYEYDHKFEPIFALNKLGWRLV